MSMDRVFSCVVRRECLLWPVGSLGKTLLGFALLHSVFQGQISLLPQVFLDFLLLHSSPLCPSSGAAGKRSYPTPEVRGGCTGAGWPRGTIPHIPHHHLSMYVPALLPLNFYFMILPDYHVANYHWTPLLQRYTQKALLVIISISYNNVFKNHPQR